VKQKVGCGFEVLGIVKPGASTEEIINTVSKDIGKLTHKDVVVVWIGTRDVARNESEKGLHQIKKFVENHKQTNVIVMSVPHRHDLEEKSCVNDDVKRFNRKLRKFMKVLGNSNVIEVEAERDLFTKHGLHMNSRGKEQIAKRIVREIRDLLREEKSDPIIMKGKEEQGMEEEETYSTPTKEPQGSVKVSQEEEGTYSAPTKEPRGSVKASQEKGELCQNSEGCQEKTAQALVQSK
jgi:RNase H-fold protein (predicted Holliday junction resolvase)